MGDTFEKRKREQNKRRKKQDKALRKQERAVEKEEAEARGESPADDVATLEDIVGDIAHPSAREMSDAARRVKAEREGHTDDSGAPQSAAARRAAEAGRAVRGDKD